MRRPDLAIVVRMYEYFDYRNRIRVLLSEFVFVTKLTRNSITRNLQIFINILRISRCVACARFKFPRCV